MIADALPAVFGYTVANDVSARDWQRRDGQFSRSKSFDTFAPVGPWITTADEVADPQVLALRSWVNGEPRQDSSTEQMLFGVAYVVPGHVVECEVEGLGRLCNTIVAPPGR